MWFRSARRRPKTEPLGKLWEKSGKSAGPGDEPGPLTYCLSGGLDGT
jgi:hypothetical protein